MRDSSKNGERAEGVTSRCPSKPKLERLRPSITRHKKPEATRKTGIDVLGNTPWGTHFCLFYHDRQDLIDILVPYFKAGLENNEFCMWVTSEPLNSEDAKRSLKRAVRNLDGYIKKGQIEILDYSDWYTKTGKFEADKVLQGWVDKHNQAIKMGFDGLRLTGNTFWVEKKEWKKFTDYEAAVNSVIGKYRMLAVCTYSLEWCGASEILDVEHNHQFALIKWKGAWKILESSDRNQFEARLAEQTMIAEALQRSRKEWVETFNAISDWVILVDRKGRILRTNRIGEEFTGVPLDEIIGQSCCKLVHGLEKHLPGCPLKKMLETGRRESAELQIPGTSRWLMVTVDPVTDAENNIIAAVHITRDITERKKAEKALQKSEEHYRMLAETMNDGLEQIDETGRYIYVNNKLGDILGYSPDEIVGRHWTDFFDENAQKTIKEQLFKREKGIAEPYEVANTRRDGQRIFIRISPQTIFDKDGKFKGSFGVFTDITERKKAEEALQKSQSLLNETGKMAKVGGWEFDVETLEQVWTEEVYRIHEVDSHYKPTVEAGISFYVPESRPIIANAVQKAIDNGEPFDVELQFITAKGNHRWVHALGKAHQQGGKTIKVSGTFQDITEHKKAEETLRERERRFSDIAENALEWLWETNADGNYIFASPVVKKILGYEPEEMLEKHFYDLFHPKDREELRKAAFEVFARREPFREFVNRNTHKSGKVVWLSTSAVPVLDKEGNFMGYRGADTDITDRKRAEKKLLDYQSQLKSLASQLTLAEEHERHRIATVLHDQIGQLLITSKLSLDTVHNSGSAADIAKALNEAGRNIEQIIQNLRPLTFELSSPLLYELGLEKAVAEWLTEKIRKKHRINTEFEDDGQHKPLDDDLRALLFRDVRELLTNVVKHAQAKKVKVSIRKVESRICVSVEDNGWGFDPEKIAATATKTGRFGLFSIRERLKQLGGSIEIESAPGYGTCITLCAPLKQETKNLN